MLTQLQEEWRDTITGPHPGRARPLAHVMRKRLAGMVPVWDSERTHERLGSPLETVLGGVILESICGKNAERAAARGLISEASGEGYNLNVTWMAGSIAPWGDMHETILHDSPHANTLDVAIEQGNHVALEWFLARATVSLIARSTADLLEKNHLNEAYRPVNGRWTSLTSSQRFGLARLILSLEKRTDNLGLCRILTPARLRGEGVERDPATKKMLDHILTKA